jgi:putative ABC transport system substrate-binding protein
VKRREFIILLGGATASWPLAARPQERMRRLAALMQYTESNAQGQRWVAALRDDLQKLGWIERRNLHIDYRWGGTDMNLLQRLAKEIVAAKPDVIFSSSSSPTRILKQETSTIPIIFGNIVDPVGQGLVASMARPGATSLASSIWNPPSPGNTSSCSRRSRHALAAPRSSIIRRRRPITKST